MLPLNNFSYSHLTHSATTHPVIINTIHESVTYSFPPSLTQTPVVAYFLSGPRGKNDYVCTSLSTHVCSYECALTHFPPLPSMTTCGVIQVHQVRIFRELRTYTHSAILNILCECVTQFSLFPPSQTSVRWAM